MNTTNSIEKENLESAISYYNAMCTKDFDIMENYLGDGICLISPLAEINGKEEVLKSAKKFGEMLSDIQIRSRFANQDQVMLAYDMVVPELVTQFRAAALMDFRDGKIIKIELFYDAKPFEIRQGDIFNNTSN